MDDAVGEDDQVDSSMEIGVRFNKKKKTLVVSQNDVVFGFY